jgi:hypothetical protein
MNARRARRWCLTQHGGEAPARGALAVAAFEATRLLWSALTASEGGAFEGVTPPRVAWMGAAVVGAAAVGGIGGVNPLPIGLG